MGSILAAARFFMSNCHSSSCEINEIKLLPYNLNIQSLSKQKFYFWSNDIIWRLPYFKKSNFKSKKFFSLFVEHFFSSKILENRSFYLFQLEKASNGFRQRFSLFICKINPPREKIPPVANVKNFFCWKLCQSRSPI